jgi:hypothetical protein
VGVGYPVQFGVEAVTTFPTLAVPEIEITPEIVGSEPT